MQLRMLMLMLMLMLVLMLMLMLVLTPHASSALHNLATRYITNLPACPSRLAQPLFLRGQKLFHLSRRNRPRDLPVR